MPSRRNLLTNIGHGGIGAGSTKAIQLLLVSGAHQAVCTLRSSTIGRVRAGDAKRRNIALCHGSGSRHMAGSINSHLVQTSRSRRVAGMDILVSTRRDAIQLRLVRRSHQTVRRLRGITICRILIINPLCRAIACPAKDLASSTASRDMLVTSTGRVAVIAQSCQLILFHSRIVIGRKLFAFNLVNLRVELALQRKPHMAQTIFSEKLAHLVSSLLAI